MDLAWTETFILKSGKVCDLRGFHKAAVCLLVVLVSALGHIIKVHKR